MERPDTALSTQPVDLAAIAMKAALEMESIAYEKCVTLETALPGACILRGNTDYLQRIVSSLLENALKYEPAGGRVQLTLTQDKRRVRLSVRTAPRFRSPSAGRQQKKELSLARKLLFYAAGWLDGQCSALVGQAFVHS